MKIQVMLELIDSINHMMEILVFKTVTNNKMAELNNRDTFLKSISVEPRASQKNIALYICVASVITLTSRRNIKTSYLTTSEECPKTNINP